MNILYIWDADYPWDIRVSKITESLSQAGHEVQIVCRNLKKDKVKDIYNDVVIHRLGYFKHPRLNYAVSFPLPINPYWLIKIRKIIKTYGIELIIIRDLPLALSGLIVGKKFGIPVVFDMAEDYPAMLKGINSVNKSIGNKIIRNPYVAKLIEKFVCKHVDVILAVVEESKSRLTRSGVDSDKIVIVGNTPFLQLFDHKKIKKIANGHINIVYTGGIQLGRGIQTVLKALPKIAKDIPNIHFTVIGDGYATQCLKKISNSLGVEKHVQFTGFLAHELLPAYIANSDICIIPHLYNEHNSTTIPNKLFDYMAMGRPVLGTNLPPLQRIIEEEKCGLVYQHDRPLDLAKKICLLKDKQKRHEFGVNGIKSVETKYNWEVDFARLSNVIDRY